MKIIDRLTASIDQLQQSRPILGFPYAVIKKFGDDMGGYHAALLTYYGFLSLFPLLLVLTTILHLWFNNSPDLRATITDNVSAYFPLLGDQLQSNIHSMRSTGFGLAAGLLVALYGARGGADALRFALDSIWHIPKVKRVGFPQNIIKSLTVMGVAALGFIVTAAVSAFTSGLGKSWWLSIILNIIGFIILSVALTFVLHFGASQPISIKKVLPASVIAGFVIQLLLTFGGLVVASQLKNLDTVYGTFAIVLGLLFWIYLLAQVIIYALEIAAVRAFGLWPRGLSGDVETRADERAYSLQAATERYVQEQHVHSRYDKGLPADSPSKD